MYIIILSLLFVLYVCLRRRYCYWSDKGVQGPSHVFIFGNMFDMIRRRHSLGTQFRKLYESSKHLPYAGVYMFLRPTLLINSLEMVKTVMIRDFSHFTDHGLVFDKKTQPLFNHLFNVNGSRWRGLRNKISPAFTSGKMKYMFDTMVSCGDDLRNYLKSDAEHGEPIDVKEVMGKYTTDVIVSCAFGIDSNSFLHPDAEFRTHGRNVFNFGLKRSLAFFLTIFAPRIQKIVKLPILEKPLMKFFLNTVDETVRYREENRMTRNDLMQLMIQIKNNESIEENPGDKGLLEKYTERDVNELILLKFSCDFDKNTKNNEDSTNLQLDNVELAALAFGFFVGGFETTSTTLTFIFYELAKDKSIQHKLRDEIDSKILENDNIITYEVLNSMTYMYQVIEESLRLHPPIPQLLRVCTRDYVIPETNVLIEKGTPVVIPVLGIHMDPEIYPEPEIYNPDRFSTKNKESRNHYSFLTFGEGPRMCIGNRFAIMQLRIAIVSILRHYEVDLVGDGHLKVTKNSFVTQPINTMLKFTKRR